MKVTSKFRDKKAVYFKPAKLLSSADYYLCEILQSCPNTSYCVSDPDRPDCPVIYCSSAFEKLTGYTRSEVCGRNCRFLQGPETSANDTKVIREVFVFLFSRINSLSDTIRCGCAVSVVLATTLHRFLTSPPLVSSSRLLIGRRKPSATLLIIGKMAPLSATLSSFALSTREMAKSRITSESRQSRLATRRTLLTSLGGVATQ